MDTMPRMPYGKVDMSGGIALRREHLLAPREDVWEAIRDNPLYSWNRQMGWIDTSSQMAFNALNLAKMADVLQLPEEAAEYRRQHEELKRVINEKCYDEERGFYFDCFNGQVIPRYHGGAMWALLAQVIPEERMERVVQTLQDPGIFYRKVVFPMLGANDSEYDPENTYCLGAVWPYVTYVALRGLRLNGYEEFAKACARKYYRAYGHLYLTTHTVWENVSHEHYDHPKKLSARDFCGWGALAPVCVYKEFLS